MNEFTKEESQLLNYLSKPIIGFQVIKLKLDKKAVSLGYEGHDDFLIKTGWKDRFNINEDV